MVAASTSVEIFCSYAHEDEAWLRKLETHLSLLKRQGLISFWYDRLIAAGTDWTQAIDMHLETASVILLLVSADFFASDYCFGLEMKRALARQEAGEARVIPILVRPVDWTDAPFAHLHILPTDAKPIASWRNKDTALADVTAGIRRVLQDLPLLAASTPRRALPAIWSIPYPRNPFFLGRESELALVRQELQTGQAMDLFQPQIVISGLSGMGKTQVALEYAYRHHQDYTAVLWARAESTGVLISSYIALAILLQLPEREAKEQEVIVQAVKTWLQTHRGWLLVLDNVSTSVPLNDFLPPTLGGHLIVITRVGTTTGTMVEIGRLQPEHSALFLLRRAGLLEPDATLEQVPQQQRELALQISQELAGLPLALEQAGSYLEATGMGLRQYETLRLHQLHREPIRSGSVPDYWRPVRLTWLLSLKQVKIGNPAAAELLQLCAFLAPDVIPEEILTMGASSFGPVLSLVTADVLLLNQAIEVLQTFSLIQHNATEKTFSIHQSAQYLLQDQLNWMEQRLWAERAILAVNAAFPTAEHGTWAQYERLLPQALAAAQFIERYHIVSKEAGRLLYQTAAYLKGRTRHTEAEPLYQRALHIYDRVLGP